MPHTIGLHHRHTRHSFGPEALEDEVVGLQTAGRLHININVGQHSSQGRQKALHKQSVSDRINTRDTEEVIDEASRS